MRFAREKRLLLGVWALLAPLPLPFNEILAWPLLIVYLAAVAIFLRRAHRDAGRWLPNWVQNLLAIAYLPILVTELRLVGRGQLVTPILHLALFVIVVKLFALKRDRDRSQVMLGIFFVFLAAMATSVHPSVVLYLLASLALGLLALARFSSYDVLGRFDWRPDPAALRLRGLIACSLLLIALFAVPLFALLPRVRSPYIPAPTPGAGSERLESGLDDIIGLDVLGRFRESRVVVMRVAYDRGLPPGDEPRFKGITYESFDGLRWRRGGSKGRPLPRRRDDLFRLTRDEAVDEAEVWLQPTGSNAVPVPVETVWIRFDILDNLFLGRGGAVTTWHPLREAANYRVGLRQTPASLARPPDLLARGEPTLNRGGVTPAIAELASEVAGDGPPAERARRLERHLLEQYGYTLDLLGRGSPDPIGEFLFEERSGHCELFASSLVLMLRAEGIPARLVSGFFGGEYNPLEDYLIVRELNAHAWVEAFLPEDGWVILDPTPPAGRPPAARLGLGTLLAQAWDSLVFRWDRYVLTYGVGDQLRLYGVVRDWWAGLWERFGGPRVPELPVRLSEAAPEEAAVPAEPGRDVALLPHGAPAVAVGAALLATLLAVLWAVRARRREPDATEAYRRLRARLLERPDLELDEASPPGVVALRGGAALAEAAPPLHRLVARYLRESFRGDALAQPERQALGRDLAAVEAALKRPPRDPR